MNDGNYSPDKVGERAKALYEAHIRSEVEPEHEGKFLAINVNSGDYLLGNDRLLLSKQHRELWGDDLCFLCRVGLKPIGKFGWRVRKGKDGRLTQVVNKSYR